MEILTTLAPKLVPHRTGRFEDLGDHRGYVLMSAADTGGAVALFSAQADLNGGVPPHVHGREDEIFTIQSGRFRFGIGEREFEAGPGDTLFAPRCVPHTWRCVSPEGGEMLVLFTPGENFETFIFAVGEAGLDPSDPADVQKMVALAARHGLEFLPPGK